MISIKKIEKLTGVIFKNAIRLHIDSIYLFFKKSLSSAFQLSILSQEEIGKTLFLEEVVYQARPNHDDEIDEPEYEKMINNIFLSHTRKQQWFSSRAAEDMRFFFKNKKFPKFVQEINNGILEIKKQNATYVGLNKKGNVIDWKSRIIIPKITEKETKKHISRVNDFIVNLAEGCRRGTHSVDTDSVDAILTVRLARELEQLWPYKSLFKARELINIRKFKIDEEY